MAFVDRVRAYYDVLLRTEEPYHARLRVAATPQPTLPAPVAPAARSTAPTQSAAPAQTAALAR